MQCAPPHKVVPPILRALEALREESTMAELAPRYDVHPNLIANWKRKAREQVLASFSEKKERQQAAREAELKELRAKIGEQCEPRPEELP